MIIYNKELEDFERNLLKKSKTDIIHNFRILDSLYKEARILGVFPLKNPLEGIEIDIEIARVINSVSKKSGKRNFQKK